MPIRPPREPSGHRDGAFGLLRRGEALLLVQSAREVGGERRPTWDLPGGSVRPWERLEEALVREWREEVLLEVRPRRLRLVVDGAKRRAGGSAPLYTWRAFTFDVEAEGEPQPGAGVLALAWVPEAEVSTRLDAPYHAALRDHLRGDATLHRTVDWIDPGPSGPGGSEGDALRRLLVLAAAAVTGDRDLVARETTLALLAGETAPRIEEALLQVVPYAGFPRALSAFSAARPMLGRSGGAIEAVLDPDALANAGSGTFGRVYGDTADRVAAGLRGLHPALARWTQEFAYGRVLSRPGLTLLERELLAVSILTALGDLEEPLLGHMRAAVRLGAPREAVEAAIEVVASPGAGREAARRVFARI